MIYDVRLPGYGGAAVLLSRSIAGDPPNRPGVDVWLVEPESSAGLMHRTVGDNFWPDLARYLFSAASMPVPERDLPAFHDGPSGVIIDVGPSDSERIGPRIWVVDPDDEVDRTDMDFESSRAAITNTAAGISQLLGGIDLVVIGELGL